jgi:hypothetical protein
VPSVCYPPYHVPHPPSHRESSSLTSSELLETEDEEDAEVSDDEESEEDDNISISSSVAGNQVSNVALAHTIEPPQMSERIRIPRPKGAGRMPLHNLKLNFDPFNVEDIKVCFQFILPCSPLID